MSTMYEQSGVNIEEGYRAVQKMADSAKRTKINGVLGGLGSFASMFSLSDYKKFEDPVLLSGTDGVGTKLKIAFALGKYDTIGIDAVAMCVNDVLCHNGEPIFFLDYLACGKLESDVAADIVKGVSDGCVQSGCALVGGETAEMPGIYKDGEYDIAGFVVGAAEKKDILDGSKIKSGDVLVGLSSSGFHSNGFSLINWLVKDFDKPFSELYSGEIEDKYKNKSIGEVLLTPTQIYVKPVLEAIKDFGVNGVAHITGGGFYENIPRMFKEKMTARINKNSLVTPSPFKYIQELGNVPEVEMYKTFNMGYGMIMAVDKNDAEKVVDFFNNKTDIPAKIIGEVADHNGEDVCFE